MTGQYKNGVPMAVDTSKYGVRIMPEPIYKYPAGHPCYGCPFTFPANKPSCMTGSYPDTKNCSYAFYKKIQARNRTTCLEKLKAQEG